MCSLTFTTDEMYRNKIKDNRPYHVVINHLLDTNRIKDALENIEKLEVFRCISVPVYSALLKYYANRKEVNEALKVIVRMKRNGFHPNIITYCTLLNMYVELDDAKKVEEVVKIIEDSGFTKIDHFFNTIIKYHGLRGEIEEMLKTLSDMESSNIKPDIVTYTTLIQHLAKVQDEEKITWLMNKMKSDNIKPTLLFYQVILKVQTNLDPSQILREMIENHVIPDEKFYNSLLVRLSFNKQTSSINEILQLMKSSQYELNANSMICLIRMYCQLNQSSSARILLNMLTEKSNRDQKFVQNVDNFGSVLVELTESVNMLEEENITS
eukprot:TRINITY_DN3627_c0_g1_i2.p1 TRINITY_DN3627_c0_g1~~TRINITY_DN3627_c0_g1_i2.p1  ORF type:complete len:324 (-),score=42.40 TRINITY_DN3627_c0_g1_i2:61-1032(-)